ncbi:hypothetical protein ABZ832_28755 [Streptantibioticus parmotrematis]|uniref:hypothetical protein n=1 Tax=Streptantibioticus parmotrematis TaxID=2873249 RepID=UPI0033D01E25
MAGALLLAVLAALLLAGRAWADPSPSPGSPPTATSSPSPAASPSGIPTPQPSVSATPPAGAAASSPPSKTQQAANWKKAVAVYNASHPGGVLDAFDVTDSHGIPITAYTIDEDTGSVTDWDLHVYHMATTGCFLAAQWPVALACWLLAWALSFSLAKLLLKPVIAVSDSLYSNVLLAMGLPGLFLTFSGVVATWHLLFGNRGRGWAELTASLLISALSVTTLAAPPQLLLGTNGGVVGKTRDLAVAVGATILGKTDSDFTGSDPSAALARPLTDALTTTFIVQPSMLLTYGQVFTGTCATEYASTRIEEAVYQQQLNAEEHEAGSLASNPLVDPLAGIPGASTLMSSVAKGAFRWGESTFGKTDPDQQFAKDCHATASPPSLGKVFSAGFCTLAAFLACLFVLASTTTFLGSQASIAWEAMVARCALAAGTLPGPGRAWLWSRASSIGRALAMMVATVAALAITVVVLNAIITAAPDALPGGLPGRFACIDIACAVALIKRKKLVRRSRQWTESVRIRLGNSKLGGRPAAPLSPPSRSRLGSVARAGLMVGALAATGGAASLGYGLGTRTGARTAVRALTSRIGGLGRTAGRAAGGAAKASSGLGKFGLKYSVGLPVYGPRAARAAQAAAKAMPATAVKKTTLLRKRLAEAHDQYAPPARDFAQEYWRGIGGQWATRRILGTPPTPPPPARKRAPRTRPAGTASAPSGVRPTPGAPRTRLAPPRTPAPPASSQQAVLQQRLHRIRARRAAPPPRTITPPTPRPAPRRRSAGSNGKRGGRGGAKGHGGKGGGRP